MRYLPAVFCIGIALALGQGCKTAIAPLPANAINSVDAGINENLQAAHAFIVQYESDVASGKHAPTANEKAAVNKVIAALNVADPLYQSYHTALASNPNTGEPAELAAAITAVTDNLSALIALVKGN